MVGMPKNAEGMSVGQLLSQVCRMTGHHLRTHMERLGLHRGQGFALVHLWHDDGIPQRKLGRAMHISPASVTNMLQRMERSGWVKRVRDEDDQRVVRVFLTPKAQKLREEAASVFRQMESELNEVYTAAEQATLKRLLLKLHDRFAPDAVDGSHHPPFFKEAEGRSP